jgi:hypothetical protein
MLQKIAFTSIGHGQSKVVVNNTVINIIQQGPKSGNSITMVTLIVIIIIIIIISCLFPGTSPLEPVVNPTTQASSLSL